MRVLITGASGQLGYCLQRTAPSFVSVQIASRNQLDFSMPTKMTQWLDSIHVDAVINTAVDQAENEPVLAEKINAEAVKILAKFCKERDIPLLQVSTDFVFDGLQSRPYGIEDITDPLSIYGKTKLQGENYALQLSPQSYVVRTGWVYCEHGQNL